MTAFSWWAPESPYFQVRGHVRSLYHSYVSRDLAIPQKQMLAFRCHRQWSKFSIFWHLKQKFTFWQHIFVKTISISRPFGVFDKDFLHKTQVTLLFTKLMLVSKSHTLIYIDTIFNSDMWNVEGAADICSMISIGYKIDKQCDNKGSTTTWGHASLRTGVEVQVEQAVYTFSKVDYSCAGKHETSWWDETTSTTIPREEM